MSHLPWLRVTLDRRALWSVLGVVYVLSFGLNLVWEMLQMPLFGGMDWSSASWAFCTGVERVTF